MIEIDGSFGEGGGQILRSSLALSLLTQKPFRLRNIRAHRKPKPGLQPQHLMSVRAAAKIGNAKITGDSVGSSLMTFEPKPVVPGQYHFKIGTAGATPLVLHTIYLPLLLCDQPSELIIEGGTHVAHAPCFNFLQTTWRPYLERLGFKLSLQMKRPGFYPRGGGQITANLQPCSHIEPLQLLDEVEHAHVDILSITANLPEHVAGRQAKQANSRLREEGLRTDIETEEWDNGPSSVLMLTLPEPVPTMFFAMGARGKPAEEVADEAADEALAHVKTKAPVDPHSADQLLLPLCFAKGESAYRVSQITQHLLTNAAVIQMFLKREIKIEGEEGATGIVKVRSE